MTSDTYCTIRRELSRSRGTTLEALTPTRVRAECLALAEGAEEGTLSHDDSLLVASIAVALLRSVSA